jgi:hypothetical protein
LAPEPTAAALRATLGPAHAPWARLIELVEAEVPGITRLWRQGSTAAGWSLRLVKKGRVILYLSPREGFFLVSTALGEKAVAGAKEAKLPAALLKVIDAAPRYAEGRGFRVEVRTSRQVAALAALAGIKSRH